MDLYAFLIITLVCVSTTFAKCPDKCTCKKSYKQKNDSIIKVDCDGFEHIPLEVITSDVFVLIFRSNNITVLSNIDEMVENTPQLKTLDLTNNHISKIEVNALRVFNSLENLNLFLNNISSIPTEMFKTLPKLKKLNLSHNPYLILPENGYGTKELNHLVMEFSNLKALPPKFFDTMPNIKRLDIEYNHISYLGSHVIIAFQKMTHISLKRNNLTVFEPELISLLSDRDVIINLCGNPFRCDCPFRLASQLKMFQSMSCVTPLRYNDIDHGNLVLREPSIKNCEAATREAKLVATNTSTSFGSFAVCPDKCTCKNLTTTWRKHLVFNVECDGLQRIPLEVITSDLFSLIFQSNDITVLPNIDEKVKNVPQLKDLHLINNHILEIEVNALRVFNYLEKLNLMLNNISSIPNKLFKTLPELKKLNLGFNPNLILPENGYGTKKLQDLVMNYCNLKAIPPKFFDTMPNIKRLDLTGNHISYLGSQLITHFQKMTHVLLKRNNLTVVEPELISLLTGRDVVIELWGNHFRYDCPYITASRLKQFPHMSYASPLHDTDIDQGTLVLSEIASIQDCEAATREATTVATNTSTSFGSFAVCPDKCTCRTWTSLANEHQVLSVDCEGLQHIPLEVITNDVFKLIFQSNNITVLSNINEQVENITQFKVLDLKNNHITKLKVNALKVFNSLENLILLLNNISSIPNELFKTLPKLKELNLGHNPNLILPENGYGAKELEHLVMNYCNLKAIPPKFFDTMPNIKSLDLEGNHISYLGHHVITAFQKMTHVSLEWNNLTVFEPELVTLLTGRNLHIHLYGNPFRCDCPLRVASQLKQFRGMSCVSPHQDSDIDLNTLVLPEIPSIQDCEAVKREAITVATNTSTAFDSFAMCPDKCTCKNLTYRKHHQVFNVECDGLQYIPLEVITSGVFVLIFQSNNITVLSNINEQVENITQLKDLDLMKNHISKIEVDALRVFNSLENLNLALNNISSIPNKLFKTLPKLKKLNLSFNPNLILSENGYGAKELKHLVMNYCNLKAIPQKFFDTMPNIKRLDLEGNQISYLGYQVIAAFQKMKHVSLEWNNLTVFEPELVTLLTGRYVHVHLKDNPFRCDCPYRVASKLKQFWGMSCVSPHQDTDIDFSTLVLPEVPSIQDCEAASREDKLVATNTSTLIGRSEIYLNNTEIIRK